jgi:hypothetical protein
MTQTVPNPLTPDRRLQRVEGELCDPAFQLDHIARLAGELCGCAKAVARVMSSAQPWRKTPPPPFEGHGASRGSRRRPSVGNVPVRAAVMWTVPPDSVFRYARFPYHYGRCRILTDESCGL